MDKYLNLPNIIFLDGVPSSRLGGISQTLYNLFDDYPSNKLYALVDKNQLSEIDASSLKCQIIEISVNSFDTFKRRFISSLNPFINVLNAICRDLFGISVISGKLPQDGLLLVCTTGIEKLHAAKKIHQKYGIELLTYFMDDWTNGLHFNWLTGNIDEVAKYTLDNAVGRLMISEMLNDSLVKRYQLSEKPTYIVHNPVEINYSFEKPADISTIQTIKIIYAGSIWAMHLDALVIVAQAVELLNTKTPNSFELCIYSKQMFWDMHKDILHKNGVNYLGFINYDQLHEKLISGNLLLVTSSFEKKFEPFSRSSVQTKITDYMKEGKPILSVGPAYGACNWFIDKWQCGYVFDNNNCDALAVYLLSITLDNALYQTYSKNAYQTVKQYFSKSLIQQKLYTYIDSL